MAWTRSFGGWRSMKPNSDSDRCRLEVFVRIPAHLRGSSSVERYRNQPVVLLLREGLVLGGLAVSIASERTGVVPNTPFRTVPDSRVLGKHHPRCGVVTSRRATRVTGRHPGPTVVPVRRRGATVM